MYRFFKSRFVFQNISISNLLLYFVVIEVSSGEYGDHNVTLVKYIENGKLDDWSKEGCIEDSELTIKMHVDRCIICFFSSSRSNTKL